MNLVDAYKRFAVAFAANGDIFYGEGESVDGAVFHFPRLSELASVASIMLAGDCRVAEGVGLGDSICWPAELDSKARASTATVRNPMYAAGVARLLADLGRAQEQSMRPKQTRALFDEAERWAELTNDPTVASAVAAARSQQPNNK